MSSSKRSCGNSPGPFLLVTALILCHLQLWPQSLTKQFPSVPRPSSLPDAPDYPIAEVVQTPAVGVPVRLEAREQEKRGSVYLLTGDVKIDYKDYKLSADKVSFNEETKEAEADGHVRLAGGRNNELILADHGKMNFEFETGRFENVTGSIGRRPSAGKRRLVYTTSNPFLFAGRVLTKEQSATGYSKAP
jgi:LPS-assembly protein